MSSPTRPACTIILCAPTADGFSVFMVQRHRKSGFLPNAWVFPGGRVDDGDRLDGHARVHGGAVACEQMGLSTDDGVAFLVAGVRETFEEAGIWLGSGQLPDSARDALNDRTSTLAPLLDQHDVSIDLDALGVWSWWVTPKAEPKRYDTRFLVAIVAKQSGRHDDRETVDSAWIDPRKLLEDWSQETFTMAPPTWWVLKELARYESAAEVAAACATRDRQPIEPVLEFNEGFHLYLPGHERHDSPKIPDFPVHIGFDGKRWLADF